MTDWPASKVCSKCGLDKPLGEYLPQPKGGRYGRTAACRECNSKRVAEYKARNKMEIYKRANASRRARRAANPDVARAKARESYRKHAEKRREDGRIWREKNPDKAKELRKKWIFNNRDRARKYSEKRKRLIKERSFDGPITLAMAIDKLGLSCYICQRVTDPKAKHWIDLKPELDHVIQISRGGHNIWENVRVSCLRCNRLKGAHKTPDETRAVLIKRGLLEQPS